MNKHDLLIREMQRDGIQLEDRGNCHMAACPFHEDTNPSLVIYKHRDRYRCMGCGEGGDVIDYLHKARGMAFGEAVEYLGIEHERASIIQRKPTLAELLIEREREGHDVFKQYGKDVLHGLLLSELRRLINGKQKDNHHTGKR